MATYLHRMESTVNATNVYEIFTPSFLLFYIYMLPYTTTPTGYIYANYVY